MQAPEDCRVEDWDAAGGEVGVDGCFVGKDSFACLAVDDSHDLCPAKGFSSSAPVAVGHADMAAAFGSGAFFHAGGDGPVEEAAGSGAGGAAVVPVGVIQKGGKAAYDVAVIQVRGDAVEGVGCHAECLCPVLPGLGDEFVGGKAFFER